MRIGVPTEIKPQEARVGATPAMVHDLVAAGHEVVVQAGAGDGAGLRDHEYRHAGAQLTSEVDAVWDADLVIKVKEPLEAEWPRIRPGQLLFTYFHFAADEALTRAMLDAGATCFAYETLTPDGRRLPLLQPMSMVAGRMAAQVAASSLERHRGGRGVLLGGVPGVEPATVLVLGGGVVGAEAARIAAGMGATVIVLDIDLDRLRALADTLPPNVHTVHSSPYAIRQLLPRADVVIGAVLLHGARAPVLVRREDLGRMKSDGPVLIDVAVDQGGCIETCRPTTHADPTYVVDGVLHYCVANMPGAVPRTSTFALSAATTPWALALAGMGARAAVAHPVLGTAANVVAGHVTHPGVAQAFDLPHLPPAEALAR
ncbi:MAG: alanine dehydrogenase [Alphaproteobacteria bacterium]|nr:alanine dehydrogenase [Alphaproteobacteria bacterium]